jgi:hypothetical protein
MGRYNPFRAILILATLVLLACQTGQPGPSDVKAAKADVEKLVKEGEAMLVLGHEGHLVKMAERAQAMIEKARTAMAAIPPHDPRGGQAIRHLKVVLDEAESVIVHSRKGHQDDCILHAQKALDRAKEAKSKTDTL